MSDTPAVSVSGVATPAPQLGSRRPSSSKVGSRVPALAIATSGEGMPANPDTPLFTPVAIGTPRLSGTATPKSKEVKIGAAKITERSGSSNALKAGQVKAQLKATPTKSSLKGNSGANTPAAPASGTNTPRGENKDKTAKLAPPKKLSSALLSPTELNTSLTSPPACYRARSRPVPDDGVVAAGVAYKSRYVVPRSTVRSINGKSHNTTDTMGLYAPAADSVSPRPQSKRPMAAAYSPTRLAYTNEESRQFQSESRRSGKACADVYSPEAPWEHNQFKPASPKRAGSCRPAVYTATTAPWAKPGDGTYERSARSHTAGAAVRTKDAPYGVTAGSDVAFQKGDVKTVEGSRPFGARPTSGKSCGRNPGHNDILNPDAVAPPVSPSGRRAPPASALAPSEEYVRPLSRKPVEQVEHADKPYGKRGNAMATAPCEESPFRSDRDNARQAGLSADQSAMGPQAHSPGKPYSKIFVEGRSGGVQSMHIDPNNLSAINSKFSPPRERPPTAKRNQSNIESLPGTDRDSLLSVCPVRYGRNTETLVGVMYAAPQKASPAYDVVPPFWTATAVE